MLNANGLTQHGFQLKPFIKMHDIDIMLISEIHKTTRSYLRIHNYTIDNSKHTKGTLNVGTAVSVKKSIKHHESNKLRALSLKKKRNHFGYLLIFAAYNQRSDGLKNV